MKKILLILFIFTQVSFAQTSNTQTQQTEDLTSTESLPSINVGRQKIDIFQAPEDAPIEARLRRIFIVAGIPEVQVTCKEGLITLSGTVKEKAKSEWAEKISGKTKGVFAVMNNIVVH